MATARGCGAGVAPRRVSLTATGQPPSGATVWLISVRSLLAIRNATWCGSPSCAHAGIARRRRRRAGVAPRRRAGCRSATATGSRPAARAAPTSGAARRATRRGPSPEVARGRGELRRAAAQWRDGRLISVRSLLAIRNATRCEPASRTAARAARGRRRGRRPELRAAGAVSPRSRGGARQRGGHVRRPRWPRRATSAAGRHVRRPLLAPRWRASTASCATAAGRRAAAQWRDGRLISARSLLAIRNATRCDQAVRTAAASVRPLLAIRNATRYRSGGSAGRRAAKMSRALPRSAGIAADFRRGNTRSSPRAGDPQCARRREARPVPPDI